jgi:hypothetical protein
MEIGIMGQTVFSWLRISPMASFCECSNEPSGSMKKAVYSSAAEYQLFKGYPAPWS